MYAADTHLSKTTNLNDNGIYSDLSMLDYGIKINQIQLKREEAFVYDCTVVSSYVHFSSCT